MHHRHDSRCRLALGLLLRLAELRAGRSVEAKLASGIVVAGAARMLAWTGVRQVGSPTATESQQRLRRS